MALGLFPLTLIPLVIYNLLGFLLFGPANVASFANPVFSFGLISGVRVGLSTADLLVMLAVVLLFAEILKATRTGSASLADHMMSMLVFIIYLVEFLTLAVAGSGLFLVLTVIALIDVVAGFSITIRGARRDIDVLRQ